MHRFIQPTRHFLLFLALLFVTAVQSVGAACLAPLQAPTAAQLQMARQQAQDRGFLWRISKDGHSSYLYGTIHVAKLEWTFPGDQLRAAWRATDTLALELNLLDPATVSQVQKGARDFNTSLLPDVFTEWVRQQAQENCMDLAQLQSMEPNFQLATITMANARRSGLEAAFGLDLLLSQMAQHPVRPIEALESAQEQLDALKLDADQANTLAEVQTFSPEEQAQAQTVLLKLANAWAQSDYATMDGYAQWCQCLESASDQAQLKRLIDDRNIHFAERIAALHASGRRVFAAVGSLHLIGGDKGVPGLLAQQGYAVERLF
jgi:uncharacterized protein YbaP (TraB family)